MMTMADWILVPCLRSLRDEFTALAPERDKASDGSIGDTAHSRSSSDHNPDETGATPSEDADRINEVHAIDVDDDLRKSGWTMQKCVEIIVLRHRRGTDDRLQNVIYNRRIWSRSWGWTARAYTGANAHTQHAHFSARYTTTAETDTSSWGLLAADDPEDDMAGITQTEFNARMGAWARSADGVDALGDATLAALARHQGETGVSPLTMFWRTYTASLATDGKVTALAGAVAGIDQVDETALAGQLAPLVSAQLVPAVMSSLTVDLGDRLTLTEAEVQAAVDRAIRTVLGGLDGATAA